MIKPTSWECFKDLNDPTCRKQDLSFFWRIVLSAFRLVALPRMWDSIFWWSKTINVDVDIFELSDILFIRNFFFEVITA